MLLGKQQTGVPPSPSTPERFHADSGGLLFKKVTPQRRQDQFGRDNTRHADYLLSMAVFPTGVRTPLLSDLQRKTDHQCGFQVIDKGLERPVKQVHIRDSPQFTSSRHGSAVTDSSKKPPPNTPLSHSVKMEGDRAPRAPHTPSLTPSPPSSPSRQQHRWTHSSTERPTTTHSVTAVAGTVGVAGVEGRVKDIRDPLYIHTYCPEERQLRYKKSSLPRLASRARPWTVSEQNPSYRFSKNNQTKENSHHGKSAWPSQVTSSTPRANNFRINARDIMARAKGRASAKSHDDMDEDYQGEGGRVGDRETLLEVKSYFPQDGGVLGDQRQSLRGKDGCLHAKIKQCIKFVKYREKLARGSSVERPMKSESGRYRPFSTTTIRPPRSSPSAHTAPRHPDPTSVEIYKQYIDTIALQTRLVSAAEKRRKPRPAVSGLPRYNTAASSYHDSALQSVAESTHHTPSLSDKSVKPEVVSLVLGSSTEREVVGRVSDPYGVHHALDIIRLSPKAQPQRSSRTARAGRSFREGEEEGEKKEGEQGEKKGQLRAIVLPNVCKSASASVCSVEESANVVET